MTQFGYPKAGYYYKIETSQDGKAWELYTDHEKATSIESVYIDITERSVIARYVRVTVLGAVVEELDADVTIWELSVF
jgi:hypothetical protein